MDTKQHQMHDPFLHLGKIELSWLLQQHASLNLTYLAIRFPGEALIFICKLLYFVSFFLIYVSTIYILLRSLIDLINSFLHGEFIFWHIKFN